MSVPTCPYCLKLSELVAGDVVYPHRRDLARKKFYMCRPCDAWVGCHPDTNVPLGRLANKELRMWKQKAHDAFDPLWHSGKLTRSRAYQVMCELMGISRSEAHIGMFSVEQCKLLIQKIEELNNPQLPLK